MSVSPKAMVSLASLAWARSACTAKFGLRGALLAGHPR